MRNGRASGKPDARTVNDGVTVASMVSGGPVSTTVCAHALVSGNVVTMQSQNKTGRQRNSGDTSRLRGCGLAVRLVVDYDIFVRQTLVARVVGDVGR